MPIVYKESYKLFYGLEFMFVTWNLRIEDSCVTCFTACNDDMSHDRDIVFLLNFHCKTSTCKSHSGRN